MKSIKKYWQLFIVTIITLGLGTMSFLITQKLNKTTPVAPNVPQVKPKAAVPACILEFTLVTNTPTPTSTPSGSLTPTPTGLQCNSTCTANGPSCPSGQSCSNGKCRNPSCTEEADCSCPGVTNTPTHTPTKTPTPTPLACNAFCDNTSNSCSIGRVCSNGKCRNPSCTGEADCTCPGTVNSPTPTVPYTAPTPKIPVSGAGTTILGATVIGGGLLLLLLGLAL